MELNIEAVSRLLEEHPQLEGVINDTVGYELTTVAASVFMNETHGAVPLETQKVETTVKEEVAADHPSMDIKKEEPQQIVPKEAFERFQKWLIAQKDALPTLPEKPLFGFTDWVDQKRIDAENIAQGSMRDKLKEGAKMAKVLRGLMTQIKPIGFLNMLERVMNGTWAAKTAAVMGYLEAQGFYWNNDAVSQTYMIVSSFIEILKAAGATSILEPVLKAQADEKDEPSTSQTHETSWVEDYETQFVVSETQENWDGESKVITSSSERPTVYSTRTRYVEQYSKIDWCLNCRNTHNLEQCPKPIGRLGVFRDDVTSDFCWCSNCDQWGHANTACPDGDKITGEASDAKKCPPADLSIPETDLKPTKARGDLAVALDAAGLQMMPNGLSTLKPLEAPQTPADIQKWKFIIWLEDKFGFKCDAGVTGTLASVAVFVLSLLGMCGVTMTTFSGKKNSFNNWVKQCTSSMKSMTICSSGFGLIKDHVITFLADVCGFAEARPTDPETAAWLGAFEVTQARLANITGRVSDHTPHMALNPGPYRLLTEDMRRHFTEFGKLNRKGALRSYASALTKMEETRIELEVVLDGVKKSGFGKMEPVVIMIYGESGAGKSAMIEILTRHLEFLARRQLGTYTYAFNVGNAFVDEERSEGIHVLDDIGKIKSGADWAMVGALVTPQETRADAARIESKGQILRPMYIVCASNCTSIPSSTMSLTSTEHLGRRFDVGIRVTIVNPIKEEWVHNTIDHLRLDLTDYRKDIADREYVPITLEQVAQKMHNLQVKRSIEFNDRTLTRLNHNAAMKDMKMHAQVKGDSDVKITNVTESRAILLIGPPGTGKTFLAEKCGYHPAGTNEYDGRKTHFNDVTLDEQRFRAATKAVIENYDNPDATIVMSANTKAWAKMTKELLTTEERAVLERRLLVIKSEFRGNFRQYTAAQVRTHVRDKRSIDILVQQRIEGQKKSHAQVCDFVSSYCIREQLTIDYMRLPELPLESVDVKVSIPANMQDVMAMTPSDMMQLAYKTNIEPAGTSKLPLVEVVAHIRRQQKIGGLGDVSDGNIEGIMHDINMTALPYKGLTTLICFLDRSIVLASVDDKMLLATHIVAALVEGDDGVYYRTSLGELNYLSEDELRLMKLIRGELVIHAEPPPPCEETTDVRIVDAEAGSICDFMEITQCFAAVISAVAVPAIAYVGEKQQGKSADLMRTLLSLDPDDSHRLLTALRNTETAEEKMADLQRKAVLDLLKGDGKLTSQGLDWAEFSVEEMEEWSPEYPEENEEDAMRYHPPSAAIKGKRK